MIASVGVGQQFGANMLVRRVELNHDPIEALCARPRRIALALRWQMVTELAIQREWTLNLGQRSALERISHLFCELFLRLDAVGLVRGTTCELPLTQDDIAEACG